jgi:hypothetical protein
MKKMWRFLWIIAILSTLFVSLNAQDSVLLLKEQIISLQNQGELGFRNFKLCSNIIGYGQYVPSSNNQVKAGSEIFFYYEPVNLFTNRLGGIYQIWYTQDIILLSQDKEEIYNAPAILNFNYQTTSPVLDVYATNSLDLGELPPGFYEYKAVMHDKLKKVNAAYTYTFEIIP